MSVLGGEAEGRPLLKEAEFVHEASDSRSGRAHGMVGLIFRRVETHWPTYKCLKMSCEVKCLSSRSREHLLFKYAG